MRPVEDDEVLEFDLGTTPAGTSCTPRGRRGCGAPNTARAFARGTVETEAKRTTREPFPSFPVVDPDEAQRIATEAVEALRRESLKAMEAAAELAESARAASAQTQELAEAAHARARALAETTARGAQVLGEALQARTQVLGERAQELLGDDFAGRAQEMGQHTRQGARMLGGSLWRWGQELQRAASWAICEDPVPQEGAARRQEDGEAEEELLDASALPRKSSRDSSKAKVPLRLTMPRVTARGGG